MACNTLAEFDGTTSDQLVEYTLDLQGSYEECALRQKALGTYAMQK